jgi:hypothetical protein
MIRFNLIRDVALYHSCSVRRPSGRAWFSSFGNEATVQIHGESRVVILKVSSLYRYGDGAEGGRFRPVMRWRLSR